MAAVSGICMTESSVYIENCGFICRCKISCGGSWFKALAEKEICRFGNVAFSVESRGDISAGNINVDSFKCAAALCGAVESSD
ncbi:hypothetical protein SDC9_130157 [bioreactor metagenome]|uniref:Uncharacterized protein n=1 Tax=bioreactor metagenome TaxID=1076179 RepID=A0A645D1I3_9ZZZZ